MHPWAGAGVLALDRASELALGCERFGSALVGQPANAVTSLAFLLAGAAILASRRGGPASRGGPARHRWAYGLLVAAVGAGSVVQHGPHPPWQAYAHDLPLAALLGFVAADAVADLTGRRRWPGVPPVAAAALVAAAMVPVVAAGPGASTGTQALLAVVAIGLSLLRARRRPALRRPLLGALVLLASGALAGTLTDRTPLCQPDSLWQGHAAWHLLAAVALWWLAPAIGTAAHGVVRGPGRPPSHDRAGTVAAAPDPEERT